MAWPLRAALIVLLLPAALLAVATPRWREIRYDGGDWRLRDARGVWHAARLLPETLRHPWLVVLQLRLDDDRRAVVPLFYDSLSADDHCALRRVLLRSVSQRAR